MNKKEIFFSKNVHSYRPSLPTTLTKLMQNISQFARSSICMGDNPLAQIVDNGLSPQTDEQNKHGNRIITTSAILGFR